ncbi:Rz1-like lysis system protein LysC [Vibrio rotiferianus]|uniref:Rz1-like lysis system protein LysC n=1 Tax=Vibrio rotiferianus TaxID=190895 RepID=UPI003B97379A
MRQSYVKTLVSLLTNCKTLIATFLLLLLSGCANRTEVTATEVEYRLPPAGMLLPCPKPFVNGTWPKALTEDIPKLKHALNECDSQITDYLNWRAEHEQTKRENHD